MGRVCSYKVGQNQRGLKLPFQDRISSSSKRKPLSLKWTLNWTVPIYVSVNMITGFTICVHREIRKWQLSLFFVFLSERLPIFCLILREITKIIRIKSEQDFTIQNWNKMWFRKMLKFAFELELSVNVNSLTY